MVLYGLLSSPIALFSPVRYQILANIESFAFLFFIVIVFVAIVVIISSFKLELRLKLISELTFK